MSHSKVKIKNHITSCLSSVVFNGSKFKQILANKINPCTNNNPKTPIDPKLVGGEKNTLYLGGANLILHMESLTKKCDKTGGEIELPSLKPT